MTNPWSYFFLKKNYYFMKYGIIFIFALSFTVNGFSQNYAGELYPPDQPHLAYHQNPVELCT
jgi:hypothetical protein